MCAITINEYQCPHIHRYHESTVLCEWASDTKNCEACSTAKERPWTAMAEGLGDPSRHDSECPYVVRKGLPCAQDTVWWIMKKPGNACGICEDPTPNADIAFTTRCNMGNCGWHCNFLCA